MSIGSPPLICSSCGERLVTTTDAGPATAYCRHCHSQMDGPKAERLGGDVFNEVWANLSGLRTWGQVAGWAILGATTFLPVMAMWGANRIKPDDPLLPLFVVISIIGGAVGMSLLYPKKGYWLPGVIAGPLFGPGVFLAFWLLAGTVMNKLIFLALILVGGGPGYALYVILLCNKARQNERAGQADAY